MTQEELLDRLQGYEWNDIEFKQARKGVSQDAYKTVSAFANTAGGWLVFGIRDAGGSFEVVGVVEVDKVQNDFLSVLRSGDKLNRKISVTAEAHEVDGKTLLVFHVPESPRRDKPIYLDRDIRESFIRRGAGDERCTMAEIEQFLRDAADTKYDGELLDLEAERVFDTDSLREYRRVFEDRNPGRRQDLSDMEFLREWGFVKERSRDGRLAPTRAAVLVLGRGRYVRHVLARPVVDYQFINSAFDAWSPDLRWDDRIVVEENLLQAWLTLSERFMQRAERPFRIDPATLRRDDDPPDYISFREAAINLLLHQDYGNQGRQACIRLFRDRMEFRNPGEAFASTDELLEPGAKEVRNPDIVAAFRRLGWSEQAGTGIRAIFRNWQALGHVPPVIDNDKAGKSFKLYFLRDVLLSDEQRRFQDRLGLRLSEAQARAFAFACRDRRISLVDAKAVTGLMGRDAAPELEALEVLGLLRPLQEGLYGLAEHIEGHADLPVHGHSSSDHVHNRHTNMITDQGDHVTQAGTNMVTDQADDGTMSTAHDASGADPRTERGSQVQVSGEPLPTLSAVQRCIIAYCDVPRLLAEIMDELGASSRTYFKRKHLNPLIGTGLVAMTNPTHPRARGQRYMLTDAGLQLRALHFNAEQAGKEHGQD